MRQRIMLSVLGVLAVALVAFAVPLAVSVRGVMVDRALDELQAEAEQLALFIDDQARTCGEAQLYLALAERGEVRLSLWTRDGRFVAASGPVPSDVGNELVAAAKGRIAREHGPGRLVVATPLATDACGRTLILRAARPDAVLAGNIRAAWTSLALVGAGVLGVAAAAAVWLGGRLARPLERLAAAARAIGDGDFTARSPRSGIEEADEIAAALDTTAERLGRAVQRGRAFTADASHQLRTPLTALRLQLEALEASDADPEVVADALEEADRLEATIEELVALTRIEGADEDLDLGALVEARVRPWRAHAERVDRRMVVEVLPVAPVRARPAAIGQALQVLLDNAFEHGRGTVTVRVAPSRPDEQEDRTGVRICVRDEGPGIDLARVQRGPTRDRGGGPLPARGGRGLALARSLVEAEGGSLVFDLLDPGTQACMVLPGTP